METQLHELIKKWKKEGKSFEDILRLLTRFLMVMTITLKKSEIEEMYNGMKNGALGIKAKLKEQLED